MSRIRILLSIVLIAVAEQAVAQAAAPIEEFLAAREAYRTGNSARLDQHAARLKGHLLESYVLYWQLSPRLEQASVEQVRGFLAEHSDSPLSERVRNEWLKVLGRRGDW